MFPRQTVLPNVNTFTGRDYPFYCSHGLSIELDLRVTTDYAKGPPLSFATLWCPRINDRESLTFPSCMLAHTSIHLVLLFQVIML